MRGKKAPASTYCAHFTGNYVGKCRAGVVYEDVKDQSRRSQMERFPCDRSLNCFTTCEGAHFTPLEKIRRRIDVSAKNWKRTIIYTPGAKWEGEPVRGLLVGCSGDQATAFIRICRSPKRTQVIAVAAEQCRFARKRRDGDATASQVSGDLPLFDFREAPASAKREKRGQEVEQAA